MTVKTYNEETPLHAECCLCLGQTTMLSSASAYIAFGGKEYRLYYHKVCFESIANAKDIITAKLKVMMQ